MKIFPSTLVSLIKQTIISILVFLSLSQCTFAASKDENKILVTYTDEKKSEILSVSGLSERYSICGDHEFSGAVIGSEPFDDSLLVTLENELGFRESLQIDKKTIEQTRGYIKQLFLAGTNLSTNGQICGSGGYYYVGTITKIKNPHHDLPKIHYSSVKDMVFDSKNAIGKNILLVGKFNRISLSNQVTAIDMIVETDTNIKYWNILFSDKFTPWAKTLKQGEPLRALCKISSIQPLFSKCNLIRLYFD